MDLKPGRLTSLIGALILLHCASVDAYVLPGPQLIDLMVRHMGIADTLEVAQRVVSPRPQPPPSPQEVTPLSQGKAPDLQNSGKTPQWHETLSYRGPGAFRVDSRSGDRHRITIMSDGAVLAIVNGRQVPQAGQDRWNRYLELLCYPSRDVLQKHLARSGVDVMTSSIGRYQGTPCWILGAQYPDLTLPQIWIDKETFLPFRWLIPHIQADGTLNIFEFRFLKWQKADKLWYPMDIQMLEHGALVREIFVDRVQVDPALDSKQFDIDSLKRLYPVSDTPPTQVATPKESNDSLKAQDEDKGRSD